MHIPPHLLHEQYNDRYFDVVNAIDEAHHIFFEGNRIIARLSAMTDRGRTLAVGETGFGAGRLFLALIDLLDHSGLTDITIRYFSVELHPLTANGIGAMLEGYRPRIGALIDLLTGAYGRLDTAKGGWHTLIFERPFGKVELNLWIGEALEMVSALETRCDCWFLDGHGPKKNPDMWRPELLAAVGEKSALDATVATYTVASVVRHGLEAAGFTVERVPGYGGKNVVLRGSKTTSSEKNSPPPAPDVIL